MEQNGANDMFSYLAFLYSGIETASENTFEDGARLASHCIAQLKELNDEHQFPPRLLILLASPTYLDSSKPENLLNGINQTFAGMGYDDILLIGSSVAAVFFDRKVHKQGALLVCLASRLMETRVAIGSNARKDPDGAMKSLLSDLELVQVGKDTDPNPFANRILLTFFPGFGEEGAFPAYPAPDLHRRLREEVKARIRIVGGVSSANDPRRVTPGLQFAGNRPLKDALVCAMITCGAPMGISLGHGSSATGRILQAKRLSEDRRTILEFDQGSPIKIMQQEGAPILLGEMSTSDEPMFTVPRIASDGQSLQLLSEIKPGAYFEALKPRPEKLIEAAIESITLARDEILIQKPVTSLMLPCNLWHIHAPILGMNLENSLANIEDRTGIRCVGGFVDGEAGVDETTRSLFSNGGVVGLVFGDEMRERTPMYRGFNAFVQHGHRLAGSSDYASPSTEYDISKVIEEAISAALQIVVDTGFPGAMLSLLLHDQKQKFIVARQCIGHRFAKIVEKTRMELSGNDILAVVAREKSPRFIEDSRTDSHCDPDAVSKSGIVSQYVMPLVRLTGDALGILQVDLGEVKVRRPAVENVLNSLGDILASSLNRLFNLVEVNIARSLDPALNESLSAETIEDAAQRMIEKATAVLKLKMGHVRLADHENQSLTIIAGVGRCYDAAKETRRVAAFNDLSLICEAFMETSLDNGTAVVTVNNAQNNHTYIKMCKQRRTEDPNLYEALSTIKSYATVVFGTDKGEKLGAFSLAATEPWFFTPSHERALAALGQRLGVLVEHFRRKQGEKEAMKRLEFLFDVSPQFARIQNFDDPSALLTEATEQFSEAVGAEYAALYLWDEDQSEYILRAQYNWSDPRWVNAARHRKNDYWTGRDAAAGSPFHVPDLREYFQAKRDKGIKPRYNVQIFGQELSPTFTVESIGSPLWIAGDSLGVLTLYRQIVPGKPSGFTIIDPDLLLEAADRLAGLVSVLKSHRKERWHIEELTRRQEVHEATITRKPLSESEQEEGFETRVCRQVLKSYRAIEAVFYKYEPDKDIFAPIQGLRRSPRTEAITILSPSNDIPAFVWQTAIDNQTSERRIKVEFQHLSKDDWKYPEKVATQNLVNRACIPLVGEEQLVGFLDLRWRVDHRHVFSLSYHHDERLLLVLGNVIGSAYFRHRLAEEREQSDREAKQRMLAVEAMAAMVAQSAHRFKNHLVSLDRLAFEIKEAVSDTERELWTGELVKTSSEGSKMVNRPMRVAERTLRQVHESYHLYSLIVETIGEIMTDELQGVDVAFPQPSDIYVAVDPDNVREAFVNILSNSAKSLKAKNSGSLIISILVPDNNCAQIVFEDTGIGMTEDEIKDAMGGFVNTQSSSGIGVLLSRVLLEAQGGNLKYESKKGSWTKAIVTLPLAK